MYSINSFDAIDKMFWKLCVRKKVLPNRVIVNTFRTFSIKELKLISIYDAIVEIIICHSQATN